MDDRGTEESVGHPVSRMQGGLGRGRGRASRIAAPVVLRGSCSGFRALVSSTGVDIELAFAPVPWPSAKPESGVGAGLLGDCSGDVGALDRGRGRSREGTGTVEPRTTTFGRGDLLAGARRTDLELPAGVGGNPEGGPAPRSAGISGDVIDLEAIGKVTPRLLSFEEGRQAGTQGAVCGLDAHGSSRGPGVERGRLAAEGEAGYGRRSRNFDAGRTRASSAARHVVGG